jgi:hypothetical protein
LRIIGSEKDWAACDVGADHVDESGNSRDAFRIKIGLEFRPFSVRSQIVRVPDVDPNCIGKAVAMVKVGECLSESRLWGECP